MQSLTMFQKWKGRVESQSSISNRPRLLKPLMTALKNKHVFHVEPLPIPLSASRHIQI